MSDPASPRSPTNSGNPRTFSGNLVSGNLVLGNLVSIERAVSNIGTTSSASGISGNIVINVPIIIDSTLDETIVGNGYIIGNEQGTTVDGTEVTHSTFDTTDPTADPQLTENLVETVNAYYDDEQNSETKVILDEIKLYAGRIQCDDFHGKGSIDDYSELFRAAAKIANESKQIKLDVDVAGFNEFSDAADELANLFNSFIVKLENVSIINDLDFLRAISIALRKIWNLSEVFGKFKQTILATSTIHIPKSAHDTSLILQSVLGEVNCAMKYINHFVSPDATNVPTGANLSTNEQTIITQAVHTIDNWNVLCDQGVSIAMANNPDIQQIISANTQLKSKTTALKNATSTLKAKFALYNINRP